VAYVFGPPCTHTTLLRNVGSTLFTTSAVISTHAMLQKSVNIYHYSRD